MIDWLIADEGGLPAPEYFLAPSELERYTALRSAKRRQDWLLGRWATKRLICRHFAQQGFDLPLDTITVLNDPDGAPRLGPWGLALACPHIGQELAHMHISLSHSGGKAVCAMISNVGQAGAASKPAQSDPFPTLGVDIEQIEARGSAFAETYDTQLELDLLAAAPPEEYDALATAIWSAKEATLKLTRHGLRVDTRTVTCLPAPPVADTWVPISIHTQLTTTPLAGWWREYEGCVVTIVATATGNSCVAV